MTGAPLTPGALAAIRDRLTDLGYAAPETINTEAALQQVHADAVALIQEVERLTLAGEPVADDAIADAIHGARESGRLGGAAFGAAVRAYSETDPEARVALLATAGNYLRSIRDPLAVQFAIDHMRTAVAAEARRRSEP